MLLGELRLSVHVAHNLQCLFYHGSKHHSTPPMYLESTEFFRGCQNVLQSSEDISEREVWSRWKTLVRSDQWGNGIKQRWCVSAGFPGHIGDASVWLTFLGCFLHVHVVPTWALCCIDRQSLGKILQDWLTFSPILEGEIPVWQVGCWRKPQCASAQNTAAWYSACSSAMAS